MKPSAKLSALVERITPRVSSVDVVTSPQAVPGYEAWREGAECRWTQDPNDRHLWHMDGMTFRWMPGGVGTLTEPAKKDES